MRCGCQALEQRGREREEALKGAEERVAACVEEATRKGKAELAIVAGRLATSQASVRLRWPTSQLLLGARDVLPVVLWKRTVVTWAVVWWRRRTRREQ